MEENKKIRRFSPETKQQSERLCYDPQEDSISVNETGFYWINENKIFIKAGEKIFLKKLPLK